MSAREFEIGKRQVYIAIASSNDCLASGYLEALSGVGTISENQTGHSELISNDV